MAVAVAVVIGIAIGVGVWVLMSNHHSGRTSTATSPTTSSVSSLTTVAGGTTSSPKSTSVPSSSTSSTTVPKTTTTASVPPPVVGTDSITYTLPAGTMVKVTAVDRCWVQVRASASAPVTQETILAAGQVINVPSPVWIRFGDPTSASATVGATQLELPQLAGELIVVSPGTAP